MTGFGSIQIDDNQYRVSIEVKTLNSKYADLTIRLPRQFSDKELEIRNLISTKLTRGKINFNAEFEPKGEVLSKVQFNKELFQAYYNRLKHLADQVGSNYDSLLEIALQQPDVIVSSATPSNDDHWEVFFEFSKEAIDKCGNFRSIEGENLEKVLIESIDKIQDLKVSIENLDAERIEQIKKRVHDNVREAVGQEKIDENRFEQELIYYIEKLDISEELVRLDSHISYFIDVMNEEESNGKKLGFISQELGREINTIGSKSNYAPMQRFVVQMKEELEKIKEQVLNVL